ncbi:MAG TPA: hypothetical protein VHN15_05510 [Thermoanaerobaculia bacterium]|nr:hypothetical protein [Thermoanaerobaculia bacterium]
MTCDGHYYWTYGYDDPKLSAGIGISILYFAVVAGVGGLAMLIAALLQRRKESRATLSTPLLPAPPGAVTLP